MPDMYVLMYKTARGQHSGLSSNKPIWYVGCGNIQPECHMHSPELSARRNPPFARAREDALIDGALPRRD